jgi:hypothetical protein
MPPAAAPESGPRLRYLATPVTSHQAIPSEAITYSTNVALIGRIRRPPVIEISDPFQIHHLFIKYDQEPTGFDG